MKNGTTVNGRSRKDAVAQADPSVYTQLNNVHGKHFEKRAWKFELSPNLLYRMHEMVQLYPNGILCAKILTVEVVEEITLMKMRKDFSKARTTTSFENGP